MSTAPQIKDQTSGDECYDFEPSLPRKDDRLNISMYYCLPNDDEKKKWIDSVVDCYYKSKAKIKIETRCFYDYELKYYCIPVSYEESKKEYYIVKIMSNINNDFYNMMPYKETKNTEENKYVDQVNYVNEFIDTVCDKKKMYGYHKLITSTGVSLILPTYKLFQSKNGDTLLTAMDEILKISRIKKVLTINVYSQYDASHTLIGVEHTDETGQVTPYVFDICQDYMALSMNIPYFDADEGFYRIIDHQIEVGYYLSCDKSLANWRLSDKSKPLLSY